MKKSVLFLILVLFGSVSEVSGQAVLFPDDEVERGYYNRPYKRYEAEPGKCVASGPFLSPTYIQTEIQSEASNQIAVQLVENGSYVEWINEEAADGMVIRFSIPDSEEGTGTKGTLSLYVDEEYIQDIILDSYWAWQYILRNGNKYPDNTPADTKFPRMRFDETRVKLLSKIPVGATFKLVKVDTNNEAYTIDFVELEPVPEMVTFESIADEEKVMYDPASGSLATFISRNGGKTIYIPEGRYEEEDRIYINHDGTKIIGAGMWYTEIYFSASSDDRATYRRRGIETNRSNLVLEGLFINTVNNKRYYDNNSSYQVGKGLMGSFGSNSVVRNVWIEHFECGGWITGADNLTIQHSRFRNNYADGINLASASKKSTVEYCSFRNNGDDDMASWTTDGMCTNITFRYNTAENNWRASSLGFFGGKQNSAYACVIIDPMEAGMRVNSDFAGDGFSTEGYTKLYDISIYKGGVASGTVGAGGDLWGNQQGAIHISSASSNYDINNILMENIDLYDSKNDAIFIGSGSKSIHNLVLRNIYIDGTGRYGIYYNNASGNGKYCEIDYNNIGAALDTNTIPNSFDFVADCTVGIEHISQENIQVRVTDHIIVISGFTPGVIAVYNMMGQQVYQSYVSQEEVVIGNLKSGLYVVYLGGDRKAVKVRVD